jgi:hydroxymethylpyrimidine/phosphomethylpyrimidine kinase
MHTALTIAGSDSGGGAGIQADLKTFQAFGVFGTSAITAVTAQNTLGVSAVLAMPASLVIAQIEAVVTDLGADAVKIGMLANAEIAVAVAATLRAHGLRKIVFDPVMIAKGGASLLDEAAVDVLRTVLLPMSSVITPNVPEAEALTGLRIATTADQAQAAEVLVSLGARAAIVKGGHLTDGPALDILFDGLQVIELRADRLATRHTHGTGCTFSSAIAARLARGDDLEIAARTAKAYVTQAILNAPGLGHGHGPLHHSF